MTDRVLSQKSTIPLPKSPKRELTKAYPQNTNSKEAKPENPAINLPENNLDCNSKILTNSPDQSSSDSFILSCNLPNSNSQKISSNNQCTNPRSGSFGSDDSNNTSESNSSFKSDLSASRTSDSSGNTDIESTNSLGNSSLKSDFSANRTSNSSGSTDIKSTNLLDQQAFNDLQHLQQIELYICSMVDQTIGDRQIVNKFFRNARDSHKDKITLYCMLSKIKSNGLLLVSDFERIISRLAVVDQSKNDHSIEFSNLIDHRPETATPRDKMLQKTMIMANNYYEKKHHLLFANNNKSEDKLLTDIITGIGRTEVPDIFIQCIKDNGPNPKCTTEDFKTTYKKNIFKDLLERYIMISSSKRGRFGDFLLKDNYVNFIARLTNLSIKSNNNDERESALNHLTILYQYLEDCRINAT